MQATLERLRERREERGDEGGFTLIELLIVIVILGILAAIVVFAVQNLTGQSASAGCQSDYKTVETAAEAYKAQMGAYPTDIATMTKTATQPGSGQQVGPWLRDIPTTSHYNLILNTAKVYGDTAYNAANLNLNTDGVLYVVTANGATANTNLTGLTQQPATSGNAGPPPVVKVAPAGPAYTGAGPYTLGAYPTNNASIACANVTSA